MIEIFESKDGWRYRVKGANGEILASSEAYTREVDAERGALDLAAEMRSWTEQMAKSVRIIPRSDG